MPLTPTCKRPWPNSVTFWRGPEGKLHAWITSLIILAFIGGGFLVANILQPERFADLEKCIGESAHGFFNQCDEPVNLTQCGPTPGDSSCFLMKLQPGEPVEYADAYPTDAIKTEVFACRIPMIPTIVIDAKNRSLTRNGCRAPSASSEIQE